MVAQAISENHLPEEFLMAKKIRSEPPAVAGGFRLDYSNTIDTGD
jgi:hypothetical protein